MELMGDKDTNLAAKQVALRHLPKDSTSNVSVEGAEWIVQQVDVGFDVQSTSKVDSCFLTAAKHDASLANLRGVSVW